MGEPVTMDYDQTTMVTQDEEDDIRILAKSLMMYKIGKHTSIPSITTIPLNYI